MTEYDNETDILEEERYGRLRLEHRGWGYDGELGSRSIVLDDHYCSDEELGFVRSNDTQFFPIYSYSVEEVKTWKKKFKCFDKEDMVIWGDWNSRRA